MAEAAELKLNKSNGTPTSSTEPKNGSKEMELTPGMSTEDVIKVAGEPKKRIKFKTKDIFEYDAFTVIFENNKVIEIK